MKKRFVNTRAENYLTKKRFMVDSICDENFDADLSLIDMIESKTKDYYVDPYFLLVF